MHRNALLRRVANGRVANGRSAKAPALLLVACAIAAASLGAIGVCYSLTREAPSAAPAPAPAPESPQAAKPAVRSDEDGTATAASLPARARPANPTEPEPRVRVELLDNGFFADPNADAVDRDGIRRIPWWRSTRGMAQLVELDPTLAPRVTPRDAFKERAFAFAAQTKGAEFVEQPLAAYAPYARSLVVRGKLRGQGRVSVLDGSGGVAQFEFGPATDWQTFEIKGDAVAAQYGREPMPRFLLRFEAANPSVSALWRELSGSVELPCPSEAALREELHGLLTWIFHENITRGLDSVGPVKSGYWAHDFDAITGERLATLEVSAFFSLFDHLRIGVEAGGDAEWGAALDQFASHLFAHGLHPDTGLPRMWDCTRDVARDDVPLEIALTLGFLIDLAEGGHERWSTRARDAALRLGETILARGLLPDGGIAASYYPATGAVNPNVGQLRRLDVLSQVARLSTLKRDPRYIAAVREALAAFEYTQLWSGTWQQIDPAFDDEFGHYGARAISSWKAVPTEPLFRTLALGGWHHFAPLWRDAVRLGGNCAADQVRCWVMMLDVAELEPKEAPQIHELVRAAVRGHFKGEQSGTGAWADLTVIDFDTQTTFAKKVGDFPGAPQNLLHGLAAVYEKRAGMRTDETRAMFTTVLRSSVSAYKRPHGFLIEGEVDGPNTAKGSLRLLLGIVKMYAKL
jgi:hypothetical protein